MSWMPKNESINLSESRLGMAVLLSQSKGTMGQPTGTEPQVQPCTQINQPGQKQKQQHRSWNKATGPDPEHVARARMQGQEHKDWNSTAKDLHC